MACAGWPNGGKKYSKHGRVAVAQKIASLAVNFGFRESSHAFFNKDSTTGAPKTGQISMELSKAHAYSHIKQANNWCSLLRKAAGDVGVASISFISGVMCLPLPDVPRGIFASVDCADGYSRRNRSCYCGSCLGYCLLLLFAPSDAISCPIGSSRGFASFPQ